MNYLFFFKQIPLNYLMTNGFNFYDYNKQLCLKIHWNIRYVVYYTKTNACLNHIELHLLYLVKMMKDYCYYILILRYLKCAPIKYIYI